MIHEDPVSDKAVSGSTNSASGVAHEFVVCISALDRRVFTGHYGSIAHDKDGHSRTNRSLILQGEVVWVS